MRKIRLDPDRLEVSSFETHDLSALRGTVAAHVTKQPTYDIECESGETCNAPGCPDPSGFAYTCAQFSCIEGSGCGLCESQSCDVTNCTCVAAEC